MLTPIHIVSRAGLRCAQNRKQLPDIEELSTGEERFRPSSSACSSAKPPALAHVFGQGTKLWSMLPKDEPQY